MRPGRGPRACSTFCSPGGVSRREAPAVLETIVRKRLPHRRWWYQELSWFMFVTGGAGNLLGEEADKMAVEDLKLPSFGEKLVVEERVKSKEPPANESAGKGDGAEELIPFIVGESLPVVPAKLVKKILRGGFVDMADLLKEAERRRYSQEQERGHASCGLTPYYRREIPDMLSWLHCFSLYTAVITSKYPHKARELWAYQATMVAEQRRCGGRGWLLYDAGFRQQLSSVEAADFSKINQSLYTATFLSYGGRGLFYPHCLASDHGQEDCALHPQRAVPVVRFKETGSGLREDWRPRTSEPRRKRPRKWACFAWNDGQCSLQNCRFEHVCSKCSGDHRRSQCRANRGDPDLQRPARGSEEQHPGR